LTVRSEDGCRTRLWNVGKILQSLSTKKAHIILIYEAWNFNSGNYLFTTDTK